MVPLFILTFTFIIGIGFLFATTDRQDVMAHWDEKRCSPAVMFFGNFYKPMNDPKSDVDFAIDNFTFCTKKIVDEALKIVSAPILEVMNQQLDIFTDLQKVIGSLREMIGNFFRSFSDMIDGVFQRFMNVSFELRRIFIDFFQIMSRAAAIGVSATFAGISMIIGIQNFYDFIIKVVLIILGIMSAIIIVLMFILFPVMPIIMSTIAVMVAAGIPDAGGFAGVFCFSPNTKLRMKGGEERQIQNLHIGDILENEERVEGILKADGSTTDVYDLGGIHVSGDHLVFYEPLKEWICVKDHPSAQPLIRREPVLYCLNTTNHTIKINGFLFRDWEEISVKDINGWNEMIAKMIGGIASKGTQSYSIISGEWYVAGGNGTKTKKLSEVMLGDTILTEGRKPTKVIGIYNGQSVVCESDDMYWISDSVWVSTLIGWVQHGSGQGSIYNSCKGIHLITDSGTFMIFNDTTSFLVRDFTEVGVQRISETYDWTKKTIS